MIDRTAEITAYLRFYDADTNHRAAQHLCDYGFYEAANDRAFFCMFHAARALLAFDDPICTIAEPTATGIVIKNFHDRYIRQRYHDPQLSEMFEEARKIRHEGIFDRDFVATQKDAERSIQNAGYFLETAQKISNHRIAIESGMPDTEPLPAEPTPCKTCGQLPRIHNERGAGRKRIVSREVMDRVLELRKEGLSQAKIAAKLRNERGINIGRTTVGEIVRGNYTPKDAD